MAAEDKHAPATFEALWEKANTLAVAGADEEALALYRALSDAFPDLGDIPCNMAVVLARLGRTDEAVAALRQTVERDPFCYRGWFSLAGLLEQRGDIAAAADHYREATLVQPDSVEALRGLGFALHHSGQAAAACEPLQEALKLAPDDAVANFYFGNLLSDLGRTAEAEPCLRKAFEITGDAAAGDNLASLLSRTGRPQDAIAVAERMTAHQPENCKGWVSLGAAHMAAGRPQEARQAYEKALRLNPEHPGALHNLGRCLSTLGTLDDALKLFVETARICREDPAGCKDAGLTLLQMRRFDEAERWLREAISRDGCRADLWNDLASILVEADRQDEAIEALDRALAIDPGQARTLSLQAGILFELGQFKESAAKATEAVACAGSDSTMLNFIGGLFERLALTDAAVMLYERVIAMAPQNAHANSRLFDLRLSRCDWRDYARLCRRQIAEIEQKFSSGDRSRTTDVFNLQALRVDYAFVARAARLAAGAIAHEQGTQDRPPAQVRAERSEERIRLGYLLAYTHFHSLPMVLDKIIPQHDRNRFELFGYSINPCDRSGFSRHYRGGFEHFRDLPNRSARLGAEIVGRDGIDVLIDTTGLTGQTCMPIMSWRPAPLQIHGFGYSITTGADYIDYLITDRTYIPPELAAMGPEQPIYLPDTFMPAVRPDLPERPDDRAAFGLPEEGVVFCNFNHPCKFEPTIFAAWMRILQAVPGSVLWFGSWIDATRENLRREAAAQGIDGSRLIFADIVKHHEHLARLRLADLALDNLYHGGGVTTLDALAVGLPVLSVLGDTPAARLGATLLQAADMPDLICPDLAAYEARAIALAGDVPARTALTARLLAGRENAALFDSNRYVRALEAGVDAAWQRRLRGLPADVIDVPAATA